MSLQSPGVTNHNQGRAVDVRGPDSGDRVLEGDKLVLLTPCWCSKESGVLRGHVEAVGW